MGIKAWITVNGQHIPIMDGESKIQAVGRFIKGRRDAHKSNYMKRKDKFIEDNEKRNNISLSQKQEYENATLRNKRDYNKNYRPTIKGRAKTAKEIQDERLRLVEEKFPKVRKDFAKDLLNTFEVGRGKEKYRRLDGRRKTTEEDIDKKAKDITLKKALWNMDSKYGRYASNESKQVNISYKKDYIGPSKYKLKEDTKSITKELSSQDYMNNPTKGITVAALKRNNGSLSTKGYRFDIDNKGSKVWVSGNGVKKTFDNLKDAKEFVTKHDAKRESAITKRLRSGYRRNEGKASRYRQY